MCSLIFLFSLQVPAQRFARRAENPEEHALYDAVRPVLFESVVLASAQTGKTRLDIHYRIESSFFVFVKDTSERPASPFVAHGDVTVEVLDRRDVSVARELVARSIEVEKPPAVLSPARPVEGIVSFNLAPGEYTLITEVQDRESERRFFDKNRKIVVKDFAESTLGLSDIMIAEAASDSASGKLTLTPAYLGGDSPFGRRCAACFEIVGEQEKDSLSVVVEAFKVSDKGERALLVHDSLRIGDWKKGGISIHRNNNANEYVLSDSFQNVATVLFGIGGDTLEFGVYDVVVRAISGSRTVVAEKSFHPRWVDMPRSLRTLDEAIEPLEYILPREQFDSLTSASQADKRSMFEEVWKQRDPTPLTAFNEAMAEFYRRVDAAKIEFSTMHEANGARTERGKAYILYGRPTRSDRSLIPGGPAEEIWLYSSLRKKLVFVDEKRTGDYILTAEEPLQSGR